MDKNALITLLVIVGIIIVGYWVLTDISFNQEQDYGGFPIPKEAELITKDENISEYNWSRASEENGIPLRYQIELKKEGWEIDSREGAATIYIKGRIKVCLISQTNYLLISIEE